MDLRSENPKNSENSDPNSGLPVLECLDHYHQEFQVSRLSALIQQAELEFRSTVSGHNSRGHRYGFGGMRPDAAARLYGLVRHFRPAVLVESGVCNGVSSAVILTALARNKTGTLHSIDLPEYTNTHYSRDTFWPGKLGAAVPKWKQPGWLIPPKLRKRWTLTIGRSQDRLIPLLENLGVIDFFFHDSEHSYECMTFEFQASWRHLSTAGLLVSDDVTWNTAFQDFAEQQSRTVHPLATNMAFIVK